MPDITETRCELWKEGAALGFLIKICFILQNRHFENLVLLGSPVCYWVLVIGLMLAL